MEIKVLGPGCAKCKTTYNVIEKVIKENNLDVKLTKVDDIMEMMNYNIMTTPAVVIDEVVKMKGQVPTESDVKKIQEEIDHRKLVVRKEAIEAVKEGKEPHAGSMTVSSSGLVILRKSVSSSTGAM